MTLIYITKQDEWSNVWISYFVLYRRIGATFCVPISGAFDARLMCVLKWDNSVSVGSALRPVLRWQFTWLCNLYIYMYWENHCIRNAIVCPAISDRESIARLMVTHLPSRTRNYLSENRCPARYRETNRPVLSANRRPYHKSEISVCFVYYTEWCAHRFRWLINWLPIKCDGGFIRVGGIRY